MDGQDKSRKDPPIYGSGPPTVPQTGSLWYLIKPNHSPLEGESPVCVRRTGRQKPSRFPEPLSWACRRVVEGPTPACAKRSAAGRTADAVGGFNP